MADKGGLQLLPENRKKIDVKIPGENRIIYIGIALIVFVLAVAGGLWLYNDNLTTQVTDARKRLDDMESKRNKETEKNLLTLSKQVSITSQVLNNHIYWSIGFSKIEAALQNNVQFKSFSATLGEESINIRALSDTYSTLARQLAAFVAEDAIKDITLDGVSILTSDKLDFNAKINFDTSKFLKSK